MQQLRMKFSTLFTTGRNEIRSRCVTLSRDNTAPCVRIRTGPRVTGVASGTWTRLAASATQDGPGINALVRCGLVAVWSTGEPAESGPRSVCRSIDLTRYRIAPDLLRQLTDGSTRYSGASWRTRPDNVDCNHVTTRKAQRKRN